MKEIIRVTDNTNIEYIRHAGDREIRYKNVNSAMAVINNDGSASDGR